MNSKMTELKNLQPDEQLQQAWRIIAGKYELPECAAHYRGRTVNCYTAMLSMEGTLEPQHDSTVIANYLRCRAFMMLWSLFHEKYDPKKRLFLIAETLKMLKVELDKPSDENIIEFIERYRKHIEFCEELCE